MYPYVMVDPDYILAKDAVVPFLGVNIMIDDREAPVCLGIGSIVKLDPGQGEAACRRAVVIGFDLVADIFNARVL